MENQSDSAPHLQGGQYAQDICLALILGSLATLMAALMEFLGQYVIFLSDTVVLKSNAKLTKLASFTVFGVIFVVATLSCGGFFVARRGKWRVASWVSFAVFLTALLLILRLFVESFGLYGAELKLSAMLPRFRLLGWVLVTFVITTGVLSLCRFFFCETTWCFPWRAITGLTIAMLIWQICVSLGTLEFGYLVLVSLATFLISVCYAEGIVSVMRGLLGEDLFVPSGIPRATLATALGLCLMSASHGIFGFFYPIPAWKMFRYIERWSYQLEDVSGEEIVIRDYLPARAYSAAEHGSVFIVAKWLVEKEPERGPLIATIREIESSQTEEPLKEERFSISWDSKTQKATVELMRDSKVSSTSDRDASEQE